MNKLFALMVFAVGLLVFACKPKTTETTDESMVDTTAVEAAATSAPIDSATIQNLYAERHGMATGTNTTKSQKHEGKEVRYDSDAGFMHHEHSEVKPAEGADGAAGSLTAASDTDAEGYHYLPAHWATFPGGEIALDKFLGENLKYPREALNANVQGTVYASLYVDEMGQVIDARFPGKNLGYGLEEEVARVLKLMPRWNPGMFNDAAVKSKFILPVKFEIKN